MTSKSSKIYLPGLNGIRAIAAFAVIISHIGLSLSLYDLPKQSGYSLASFGVTMFFALSGFLITYLLLKEKEVKNSINVKKFYIRRALRIWPLYYFYLAIIIIFFGFLYTDYFLMYVFLIPNVPFAINAASIFPATIPYLAHYWSVGVEEQFYAFWPWIVKKMKKMFLAMFLFGILFFLLKIVLSMLGAPKLILTLLHYTRFGCLAIGGIAAYLLIQQNNLFLKIVQHKVLEVSAWLVILSIVINKFHIFSIIDHEIVTIATLVIIINQVNNSRRLISLENKAFDYLGKISYGLYIYNPLIIFLASFIIKPFLIDHNILNLIIIYAFTIILVILISHISYFYFEKQFLNFKDKFAVVKSKSSKK